MSSDLGDILRYLSTKKISKVKSKLRRILLLFKTVIKTDRSVYMIKNKNYNICMALARMYIRFINNICIVVYWSKIKNKHNWKFKIEYLQWFLHYFYEFCSLTKLFRNIFLNSYFYFFVWVIGMNSKWPFFCNHSTFLHFLLHFFFSFIQTAWKKKLHQWKIDQQKKKINKRLKPTRVMKNSDLKKNYFHDFWILYFSAQKHV